MTDLDDLIARLREAHANSPQRISGSMIFAEAAAALEALRDELARKDAALKIGVMQYGLTGSVNSAFYDEARAALKHQ